jgi:L-ribulose-5-phosphate 4-epimerase
MNIAELQQAVLEANQQISLRGLAVHTFGNASGILRDDGTGRSIVAIKPSGVRYTDLAAGDMVLTDLDGNVLEGKLRPSSDLDTHLLLYREFPGIGGIVHTHSEFATAWAQAQRPIPCFGTTHADYFHGDVPVTAPIAEEHVNREYVLNTGRVIVEHFREHGLDVTTVPGVLVAGHAPFAWGATPADAVENADLLEFVARLAYRTIALDGPAGGIAEYLRNFHYERKHGKQATYGQPRAQGK